MCIKYGYLIYNEACRGAAHQISKAPNKAGLIDAGNQLPAGCSKIMSSWTYDAKQI